jgi:hypothetical protein
MRYCLLVLLIVLVLFDVADAQFYDSKTGRDFMGNSAESVAINHLFYQAKRIADAQERIADAQEAHRVFIPLSILMAGSMVSLALLLQRKQRPATALSQGGASG